MFGHLERISISLFYTVFMYPFYVSLRASAKSLGDKKNYISTVIRLIYFKVPKAPDFLRFTAYITYVIDFYESK